MMSYEPKVDDYVIWNKPNFPVKGWVYYKDYEHITIEIGVNDKPKKQCYYAPINSTKHGNQVNIDDTRPYTAMQLNLTPLEAAFQ